MVHLYQYYSVNGSSTHYCFKFSQESVLKMYFVLLFFYQGVPEAKLEAFFIKWTTFSVNITERKHGILLHLGSDDSEQLI